MILDAVPVVALATRGNPHTESLGEDVHDEQEPARHQHHPQELSPPPLRPMAGFDLLLLQKRWPNRLHILHLYHPFW